MENRKERKTITVKDIAVKAGVSIGTVSRALAGEKGMRSATRTNIIEIANRLSYHPNLRARGLVSKKIDVIGVIIPHTSEFVFSNPYYSETLKGIAQKVREKGLYMLLSFAGEESYARMYQHGLAAGLIILGNRMDDPRIDEAIKLKVPLLLIPGYSPPRPTPSIDANNYMGAFLAVEHLIKLGHQRIGFINGALNSK
jgi:DNA-binding LacI/PurR family transcriptional regulator